TTDCARQYEVNSAIPDLLIVLQSVQHILTMQSIQRRESPDRADRPFDSRAIPILDLLKSRTDTCGSNHSIPDGFTVFNSFVTRCSLQPVTNRMSEIQNPSYVSLVFVAHHHVR